MGRNNHTKLNIRSETAEEKTEKQTLASRQAVAQSFDSIRIPLSDRLKASTPTQILDLRNIIADLPENCISKRYRDFLENAKFDSIFFSGASRPHI